MDVTPLIQSDKNVIESYGAEGIVINGATYKPSICVWADQLKSLDDINTIQDLTSEFLDDLFSSPVDVIIVARDAEVAHQEFMRLKQYHGGIEIMDFGGACRLYNVLLAEGRRIAVIFIK